jgi:hypothetical protein
MLARFLNIFAAAGDPCTPSGGELFGLPKWYKYLSGVEQTDGSCEVTVTAFNDVWKVAAAILELLLRVGAMVAVALIIWGSFTIMMAQGEPERLRQGRGTVINAVIGLIITILSTIIVSVAARAIG